ncbi:MAG TPA: hypothetical protein VM571_04420 [Noviherbaspirillum sp.]|nr:hypothetical protein [Noviherbaspirillum sp.]
MASKVECDQYAVDVAKRFEEFVQWAIAHWPNREFPLLESDFEQCRREIAEILGPKLGDGNETDDRSSEAINEPNTRQYVNMNPMPWP